MKYVKKPIVIEAVQITETTFGRPHPNPEHIPGVVYDPVQRCAIIRTLAGTMRADFGDWIIRGVKGELYPCKPDIFTATYAPAETPTEYWPGQVWQHRVTGNLWLILDGLRYRCIRGCDLGRERSMDLMLEAPDAYRYICEVSELRMHGEGGAK